MEKLPHLRIRIGCKNWGQASSCLARVAAVGAVGIVDNGTTLQKVLLVVGVVDHQTYGTDEHPCTAGPDSYCRTARFRKCMLAHWPVSWGKATVANFGRLDCVPGRQWLAAYDLEKASSECFSELQLGM